MASSLDKVASNLDDDQCKSLREFYKEEEVFRLMRWKGVYPYEYMDGCKKFEETSLLSKGCKHEKSRRDCELCLDEFRFYLLTDVDMLLMFEKAIRGRITQAVKHYAKANNKYMNDLYNPD